jgi:hypothetical protein
MNILVCGVRDLDEEKVCVWVMQQAQLEIKKCLTKANHMLQ